MSLSLLLLALLGVTHAAAECIPRSDYPNGFGSYDGDLNTSASSYSCRVWSTVNDAHYPENEWNHNYCRFPEKVHPEESAQPWCYVERPDSNCTLCWDYCSVCTETAPKHLSAGDIMQGIIFFVVVTLVFLLMTAWLTKRGISCGVFARTADPKRVKSPEEMASWISLLLFNWCQGLISLGNNRTLEQEDLWPVAEVDCASFISKKFLDSWAIVVARTEKRQTAIHNRDVEAQTQKDWVPKFPMSLQALWEGFGSAFIYSGLFKLVNDILIFAQPIVLKMLLAFLDGTGHQDWYYGAILTIFLFVLQSIQSVDMNCYFHGVFRIGMWNRTAVINAIYGKAMSASIETQAKPTFHSGKLNNMISGDSNRLYDIMFVAHQFWSAPLQIAVSLILLVIQVGWPALVGFTVLFAMIPLQGKLMKYLFTLKSKLVVHTDDRIKFTNELFQGIKIVKLMAWERKFIEAINVIRKSELVLLGQQQIYRVLAFVIIGATPQLVAALTFICYSLAGNKLTPEVVFPAISLLNIARFPLIFLPRLLGSIADMKVALQRIDAYLSEPDALKYVENLTYMDQEAGSAVVIENGTFMWHEATTEDGPRSPIVKKSAPKVVASKKEKDAGFSQLRDEKDAPDADEEVVKDKKEQPAADESKEKVKKKEGKKEKKPEKIVKLQLKQVLSNVNLTFKKGSLTMIVGCTGGGKSSLISAVLGQIEKTGESKVRRNGTVAYVPQQPWVLNATLRDNILFFKPYDEARYRAAIEAACLAADLEQLIEGDQTEIGEKGINLSGGQKQRVAIARAVYSDQELYILDDPLAAVDTHVGKSLMNDCICGVLASKTRLLATHQLQYIDKADMVVVVEKGQITFSGTPEELMKCDDPSTVHFRTASAHTEAPNGDGVAKTEQDIVDATAVVKPAPKATVNSTSKSATASSAGPASPRVIEKGSGLLVQSEGKRQGKVDKAVYLSYMKAGGGSCVAWSIFAAFMFVSFMQLATDYWLTFWSAGSVSLSDGATISIYLILLLFYVGVSMGRGTVTYGAIRKASFNLHNNMIYTVSHATMAFFDTTPLGRIVNRFTRDIDAVDVTLPEALFFTLMVFSGTIGTLVAIIVSQPVVIVACIPLTFIYTKVMRFFMGSLRDCKRLDSVNKSPIFAHFSESLNGISSIKAYGLEETFLADNAKRLDVATTSCYSQIAANRWLGVRLEGMANVVTLCTGLSAVLLRNVMTQNSALVGMGMVYAFSLTGSLNFLVRQFSDLEAQMASIERVLEYTTEVDVEDVDDNDLENCADTTVHPKFSSTVRTEHKALPPGWPSTGEIVFKNVNARYRPGLPLVCNKLTFTIASNERIGVVGRTGSGKSTLVNLLFRLIEREKDDDVPSTSSKKSALMLSGLDLKDLPLHALRSRLTIIPQDPFLFVGTVRSNLDPFGTCTEAQLWQVLDRVAMKNRVQEEPMGLDGMVSEGGQNFSVGQRQLLCLARAMLKNNCKVLIMDEATASVDGRTDKIVQDIIREDFTRSTVLTIAHRLDTIIDYDRILVMENGEAAELDTPANLLTNPRSLFHSMVAQMGDKQLRHLTNLAMGKTVSPSESSPADSPAVPPITEQLEFPTLRVPSAGPS